MKHQFAIASCLIPGALAALPACAADGTILLHAVEGEAIAVGRVSGLPGPGFKVQWEEALFSDHFLSMRPFRCLEGPEKLWCRVPYPYDNARDVSGGDLTDLEYDLIFVWKGRGDYGIDMWNGVYYKLSEKNGRIEGRLQEVNLDILAAPPDDGDMRPIGDTDLEEGGVDSHWLPRLTIE